LGKEKLINMAFRNVEKVNDLIIQKAVKKREIQKAIEILLKHRNKISIDTVYLIKKLMMDYIENNYKGI
jgi:hypothetical protein